MLASAFAASSGTSCEGVPCVNTQLIDLSLSCVSYWERSWLSSLLQCITFPLRFQLQMQSGLSLVDPLIVVRQKCRDRFCRCASQGVPTEPTHQHTVVLAELRAPVNREMLSSYYRQQCWL
jgi:hypothetical protein